MYSYLYVYHAWILKLELCLPKMDLIYHHHPSFTHKFKLDRLINLISEYPKPFLCLDIYYKKHTTKSRILFREICKLIINRCSFLDHFELAEFPLIYFSEFHY